MNAPEKINVDQFNIAFKPSGRGKARCQPDQNYPNGIDIVMTEEGPFCKVFLPYPAPECGHYAISCNLCGIKVAVTTAGRPDDPKSVTIPCKTWKPQRTN